MSLGNWTAMTWGTQPRAHGGHFDGLLGVSVELYKNWLYVLDATAWRKGPFSHPIVMYFEQGVATYLDVHLAATRGPQDGIYFACWTGHSDQADAFMVGCGVYAYESELGDEAEAWVGVKAESMDFLHEWLARKVPEFVEAGMGDCYELPMAVALARFAP